MTFGLFLGCFSQIWGVPFQVNLIPLSSSDLVVLLQKTIYTVGTISNAAGANLMGENDMTLRKSAIHRLASMAVLSLLTLCIFSGTAFGQESNAQAKKQVPMYDKSSPKFNEELGALFDDSNPGILRIGSTQILYGMAQVPCPAPSEFCQVTVKFPAPFIAPPVVNVSTVANAQTQKLGIVSLYNSRTTAQSFSVRVVMQANTKDLRMFPWMAIGRWQ